MRIPGRRYGVAGAAMLLLVLLGELTLSVRQQSLSWDEGDHLFAGYMSWKTADFGFNPEHPPLVKALAAVPLLAMHLKTPPPKGLPFFKDEAYFRGRDLIYDNGGEAVADKIIFRARMAAATLSLLLGLLVFLAGREMFGVGAALFGLALFVFEPNVVAHGAYVTTDMGVSCFLFASVYALYRYVKSPSWGRLLVMGLAAGLALASKHSAVLLLPIVAALVATEILWPQEPERRKQAALRLVGAVIAATGIAVVVLWAFYGFRYAARPGGVPMSPSLAEYAQGLHGIEPRIYLALARWHILPESYLFGLVDIRRLSGSFPTYIFGKVYAHGVWFYFPAAFVIKSTIGFMALLLLTAGAMAAGKFRARRELLFLAVPPAVYFIIAMGTGLDIGARHILPMYAFLATLIGGAVVALARSDRRWMYIAGVLLAWHIVSSARSYPDYIAYSNEFWGGPANTYKYLTDSNTDWGQQLKSVKIYLDQRGVKDCWFAYFVSPYIDFKAYGIPCRPLPTADTMWANDQVDTPPTITGTVLISAGSLTGYELGSNVLNPYSHFEELQPTAVIRHGVFVYDGTFDTRLASSLGHVTRARRLVAGKQLPAALAEAQTAVQVDPEYLQAQMVLGDVLVALGKRADANAAYGKALRVAKTMEPSARADWVQEIEKKMGGK